ncbi:hypothetical protein ASPNIDRAFT_190128 [Aspergillus niger ATCC 1015]|uniref:Major facilitator superfamily (MFS) profile domain-containing protein n=2 Tax=Aspergillus niger TaxID=5061 RepID=G3XTY4_ASPNA|nr:hypothetical protein ASPNIDRAFT_190128 [Aspergillus niger ATCC 1015]KAI3011402.1 hypothetical protein CBS147345_6327 [Aspergillus niger]TPR05525.1 GMC oxidoreductase family protein [Aspergillus niger]SPB46669.1 unnamed protein product [Aspergillus niger]
MPEANTALVQNESSSAALAHDGTIEQVQLQFPQAGRYKQIAATIQLSTVTLTASVLNGLIIVGLPTITKDLQLPASLSLWPSSVASLATATTLLLAGSIADTIGPRWVEIVGSFASGALMVGQGLARNGEELVTLRALQGVGLAMHLASSISLLGQLLPPGKSRNLAFSCLGLSLPLGFSLGLVVGGLMVDRIGWRLGWYISGGMTLFVSVIGLWALPSNTITRDVHYFRALATRVDWVGAALGSAFLALLCYLLAILSVTPSRIKSAQCIIIVCLIALALPAFIAWSHYQVKVGRPALIPNIVWKKRSFSSVCALVALSNGVLNAMELFTSLYFQEIQGLSAIQASIRILPSLVSGIFMNLIVGLFVHRVPAFWIVTAATIVCAVSPLLMALVQPSTPYWGNAFVAQVLQPVSFGALYTVGLIIVTDCFAEDMQALAGAVFNTASQFGNAIGLAVLQVISNVVSKHSGDQENLALMDGYRASFWTMFGSMILCTILGFWGLYKAGKVGLKRD